MASVNYKISKAKGQSVTELEERIAQALIDLEASSTELKPELRELSISGAKEVDLPGGKSAIVVFVPYRLLTKYHKVQTRLVRELEKKFSGKHMVILAQRRILPAERKGGRLAPQKRPRSRTLTAAHEGLLEDLVFPTDIVGQRTRYKTDGSRLLKVHLDPKEQTNSEHKTETFSAVYKKLTGKEVTFEFPTVPEA